MNVQETSKIKSTFKGTLLCYFSSSVAHNHLQWPVVPLYFEKTENLFNKRRLSKLVERCFNIRPFTFIIKSQQVKYRNIIVSYNRVVENMGCVRNRELPSVH